MLRFAFESSLQEMDNAQYVTWLYHSILKRAPDEAGLRHHATLLDNAVLDRDGLKQAFEQSPEAQALRERYESAFGDAAEISRRLASDAYPATRLSEGPRTIEIEVSSRCNVRPACVMCDIELAGKASDIPLETVQHLSPILPEARQVLLHGIGEPLMNPGLLSIIELLPDPSKAGFSTNGLLLTRAISEKLVKIGLGWINVSIDAATAPTYRRIRHNDLSRLLDNIRALIGARGERSRPQVFINMTLMKENIAEAPLFVRLGAGLGVNQVVFQQMNVSTNISAPVSGAGWVFDYPSQLLQNYPEIHYAKVEEAHALARDLGIPLVYRQRY
ncbi:MAG: radical SAM protein [Acidobacteriota bacterium]